MYKNYKIYYSRTYTTLFRRAMNGDITLISHDIRYYVSFSSSQEQL